MYEIMKTDELLSHESVCLIKYEEGVESEDFFLWKNQWMNKQEF